MNLRNGMFAFVLVQIRTLLFFTPSFCHVQPPAHLIITVILMTLQLQDESFNQGLGYMKDGLLQSGCWEGVGQS